MLRTYKWRGVFWRFEDGQAPEGAVPVAMSPAPVTPEEPKEAPKKRTTRSTRKTKTQE